MEYAGGVGEDQYNGANHSVYCWIYIIILLVGFARAGNIRVGGINPESCTSIEEEAANSIKGSMKHDE
jgi:hypothetical protein